MTSILYAYSVQDLFSKSYSPPFFAAEDAVAVREILRVASDKTSMMNFAPTAYGLWRVGLFDQADGVFKGISPLVFLGVVSDLSLEKYFAKLSKEE